MVKSTQRKLKGRGIRRARERAAAKGPILLEKTTFTPRLERGGRGGQEEIWAWAKVLRQDSLELEDK